MNMELVKEMSYTLGHVHIFSKAYRNTRLNDEIKNKFDSVVIFLASAKDGKVMLAAGSKNCNIKAGELVKAIAPIVGGGGGGRDDFATAGGKDISKISNALEEANKLIKSKL